MNNRPSKREQTTSREYALYRYISALERGDFETLVSLLQDAEQDETFAQAIEDIHLLYETEADIAAYPEAVSHLRETVQHYRSHEAQQSASSLAPIKQQQNEVRPFILQESKSDRQPPRNLSIGTVLKRVKELGLDKEFVLQRLLPRALVQQFETPTGASEQTDLALQLGRQIERIFHIPAHVLFGNEALSINMATVGATRFKKDSRHRLQHVSAYTIYAHHLAELTLQATALLPIQSIPTQPEVVRREILARYQTLSFATALQYVWSLGIPVLPLNDKGAFHGACWRLRGRNVIVIKQQTVSDARWLFDLLHELRHTGQSSEEEEFEVIEGDDMHFSKQVQEEEATASQFAGNVILDNRAEELTQMCVETARGSVERLKKAVQIVAQRERVATDALANYLAFRLSLQKIDWWGAATNLQTPSNTAWSTARDLFLQQVRFEQLEDTDRQLLQQALEL